MSSAQPSEMMDQELELSSQEIARRKDFLEFGETDIAVLKTLQPVSERYADEVIDELYRHFMAFKETKVFFEDPKVLERVKTLQKVYFLRLTQGDYGPEYIKNRLTVGAVHERIGLDPKWYLGAYRRYLHSVKLRLFKAFEKEPKKALDAFLALNKLVFLDIGIALDIYFGKREEARRRAQQDAIRELSTPVLQLRDRLLILPIIGMIDTHRARQLTERLLQAIRDNRAKVVVIDITGVPAVDSKVANHLIQTVDASRLMGAKVIVTGLSSEVAQTLVTLGADLAKLNTVGDLQGGIEEAERILGYKVVPIDEAKE